MAKTYGDWSAFVEVQTEASITGTGDLTVSVVTVDGSGSIAHTGTGSLQTSVVALSGAGVLAHTGTGDLTTGNTTVDGSGSVLGEITGTGALTVGAVTVSGYDQLPVSVVGGGIGHGGFARKRFVKVEEAESPEEVIAAIESALSESTRKPAKRKVKAKVSPKPVEAPSVNPSEWLDYYREQSRLVREQQAMQDLIARAKLKIQQLQAQETLRRLEEIQFIQQQEEEMLLLLMAA
jgi:hypothetical protein